MAMLNNQMVNVLYNQPALASAPSAECPLHFHFLHTPLSWAPGAFSCSPLIHEVNLAEGRCWG